ncbi:hypothetical protein [Pusillimonas sp. ANT_WB101]|uniref:hypothetical protein n=1 Tax=Pusillimonas sp. ANT_WB101 TaxID=2597356 RepID=UPI0011ECE8A8|nr:hypothetical protein [Pusillimonas sp. ANT_WB101]KAA0888537.1 hypothetical protein FQ179_21490 [Pusillimonas sp. ANT_WB101]
MVSSSEPPSTVDASKLTKLISLLSCGDLDEHEIARIADVCRQAVAEPAKALQTHYGAEAARVAQYDPSGVLAFIVFIELEDYFAVSDTVDELYEQVIDAFEQPLLPDYPYDDNNFNTINDFFKWVDQQLQTHHPKYCLINFGESYTHDFQVVLVHRSEVTEILALCSQLQLKAEPC